MRIHYNKQQKRITVHYSSKCHLVDKLKINKPCEFVNYPDNAENPRAWITVRGKLKLYKDEDGLTVGEIS